MPATRSGDGTERAIPAYPISSVDNALRLLEMFREHPSVRLKDACLYLGVAHSTAHRLLAMLVLHGFVVHDEHLRTYKPGPMLIDIGLAVVQKLDIRAQARPVLEALAQDFRETVHLLALEGTNVRYLDAVESERALRVASRMGSVLPAHCASGGKVLLAEMSNEDLAKLYSSPDSLRQLTDRSISSISQLIVTLEEVRRVGYATNYEETEEGVGSVAIALRDQRGRALASVAVAVPVSRLSQSRRREIARSLIREAERFSI
jgi:IclR family transcriptional regulator, acetate operon repressor